MTEENIDPELFEKTRLEVQQEYFTAGKTPLEDFKDEIRQEAVKRCLSSKEKKTTQTTENFTNTFENIVYDPHGIFWLWDDIELKWSICDEIDVLNYLSRRGFQTSKSNDRSNILNQAKQLGRLNKPQVPPKTWIQFKNKIVDVKTGTEFSPDKKFFITNPIPHNLGKSDNTPMIDELFREWVVEEGVQDESWIKTLHEVNAYTLCDEQFLQRIIALCGAGANGKGTFLNLNRKFLGTENTCASNLKALTTRNFETSALYKKKVCYFGEADSYDVANSNLIKSLTGEDLIRYEFKGKTPFSEESPTTPIIATNSLPITPDKSIGFYRRFLIVDFPHQFTIKSDLLFKISESEYENLGRKAINILKELYSRNDFTNCGTIEERTKRYEQRSNPVISFISESCEEEPGAILRLREFTDELNNYLKTKRLRPISVIRVGKLLRDEGYEIGARYFDKEKNDSAKAILSLKFKCHILKNGSLGSPDNQKLPKLPNLDTSQNISQEELPKLPKFNTSQKYEETEPLLFICPSCAKPCPKKLFRESGNVMYCPNCFNNLPELPAESNRKLCPGCHQEHHKKLFKDYQGVFYCHPCYKQLSQGKEVKDVS